MSRGSRRCNKANREDCKKKKENLMVTIRSKTGTCEKKIIKDRLKFLKEHITDKIKEDKGNRIKQVAESIW